MRNRYCPRTNIQAHFRPKWKLLSLLSFKSFTQCTQFENWGIFIFVTRLDQSRASEKICWIIKNISGRIPRNLATRFSCPSRHPAGALNLRGGGGGLGHQWSGEVVQGLDYPLVSGWFVAFKSRGWKGGVF